MQETFTEIVQLTAKANSAMETGIVRIRDCSQGQGRERKGSRMEQREPQLPSWSSEGGTMVSFPT